MKQKYKKDKEMLASLMLNLQASHNKYSSGRSESAGSTVIFRQYN